MDQVGRAMQIDSRCAIYFLCALSAPTTFNPLSHVGCVDVTTATSVIEQTNNDDLFPPSSKRMDGELDGHFKEFHKEPCACNCIAH
ncbi:hypothetical protein KIN20_028060 [Parelaphostrongylus tenuis]|uniref:Uncharacterized protein n=1 Tax=Parelaphostrongylus tenuis TaxID=148309 RepID=A0AAD5R0I9_PARTN|nr:hypothetical protein KIN20_028060 [Parelaphostrongylus tenuis]